MEYKEKYEQALEVAKKTYDKQPMYREWLEKMFPELSESEDERIRKELIEFVKSRGGFKQEYIAWLEKQSKETGWKPSKEEMDVLYGLAYITNQYDEHKEEVITHLYQDLKREFFNGSSYENMFPNTEDGVRRRSTIQVLEYARSLDTYNQYGKADIDKNIAWLERQGEQKASYTTIVKTGNGGINALITRELPTDGCDDEQKSTDKVEPKFKVGDWIINRTDATIMQIVNNKDFYESVEIGGQRRTDTYNYLEWDFRLWTIQDAKEGDVLYINNTLSESIMIYKSFNNGVIDKYASCSKFGFEGENFLTLNDGYIIPATKEQRTELFLKMHEAGYMWDSDSKQLLSLKAEPSGEQKPAWSEEEERYICQLESMVKERWALAEKAQDEEVIKNMSDLAFFLKTLNPNKKPADEDMKILLRTEYGKGRADAIAEMQNRWKPSDKHIIFLQAMVNDPNNASSESCQIVLKDILEKLKKLKEEKV